MQTDSEFTHSRIIVDSTGYHVVEAGPTSGQMVLMSHGFPESWYSWRHQLKALGEAGYHAVAVDMLGYGQSDSPDDIAQFSQKKITDDLAAIASALGHQQWIAMGHDWGAPTAWYSALRFPERVTAVIAMSVPYGGRSPVPPVEMLQQMFKDSFFYINYFQQPGVAEAELEQDLAVFLRAILWAWSGDNPNQADPYSSPQATGLLDFMTDPGHLPKWLSEPEFDFLLQRFKGQGLRGPLNYYRNIDQNWRDMGSYPGLTVAQPTLFLHGERDPCTRLGSEFDRMPEFVPNLQQQLFPGVGHWLQQEAPEQVNASILEFLSQQIVSKTNKEDVL